MRASNSAPISSRPWSLTSKSSPRWFAPVTRRNRLVLQPRATPQAHPPQPIEESPPPPDLLRAEHPLSSTHFEDRLPGAAAANKSSPLFPTPQRARRPPRHNDPPRKTPPATICSRKTARSARRALVTAAPTGFSSTRLNLRWSLSALIAPMLLAPHRPSQPRERPPERATRWPATGRAKGGPGAPRPGWPAAPAASSAKTFGKSAGATTACASEKLPKLTENGNKYLAAPAPARSPRTAPASNRPPD